MRRKKRAIATLSRAFRWSPAPSLFTASGSTQFFVQYSGILIATTGAMIAVGGVATLQIHSPMESYRAVWQRAHVQPPVSSIRLGTPSLSLGPAGVGVTIGGTF